MDKNMSIHDKVKRIALVVDDEEVNREILGAILSVDYEVIYAQDGKTALEQVKLNKSMLSVILLDLIMPGLDGFDVINVLKVDETVKNIPIIVLTSEKEAELKSLELGAADFITKPYDMPEIIRARVKRIVDLAEDTQLLQSTERDELTGLFSIAFFYEYSQLMERFNPGRKMDVVSVNIDNFHLVNELYGRVYGDKVLVTIASVLTWFLSDKEGIACRTGADSFYLYVARQESYKTLSDAITASIKELSKNLHLRFRIGVYAEDERDADSIEKKCDRARLAGNNLKNDPSGTIIYYDRKMREERLYKQRLINDMHEGLEKGQFKVYYQPKYDIRGEKPVLHSAEALIRWEHPQFGLVSPGDFISLFEENGLIQQVDHYVWREVARQLREWKDTFERLIPVSVNVSRMDIYDDDFVDELTALLEEYGLSPKDMDLEITESAYTVDSEQLVGTVNILREKGFAIEMDDFGSGYSSLNSLSTLPIDVLKMDMKFVRTMHENKKSLRLVELIMDIADYLEVPVIAEGVEVEEQYLLLKKAGCDVIQGFYFSKPVPAEEMSRLLA